ncbi:phage head-tail connector protein [Lysinibacillus sp. CD3-6]|uniref:phage head-tail connector protein n=1 Tax=Lysinibacillus sp. CD3-6 TaxID=2892541 RepID=UPI0011727BC2|nr:phage head-tail connector protein [Lysinibacillus sp. CD3-6]UED81076.1 phage head-tail connector protein [Lysinibacillus sp. CD3-6]
MELTELKILIQMNQSDESTDAYLKLKLNEAIEWVQGVCNQSFIANGVIKLPSIAKGIVAQYVLFELQGNTGIKSESIAGMSQAFDSAEERNDALIKKLSSAGLRKLRFRPFGGY